MAIAIYNTGAVGSTLPGSQGVVTEASSSNNVVTTVVTPLINALQIPTDTAASFSPRTSAPSKTDKNWLKAPTYGNNRAVEIYAWEGRYAPHSCLPNCVGYCWGRVYELSKLYNTELPTGILSTGNAKNWYPSMKKWAKGQEPRLGAIICWTNSSYGHVAMVEKINYDKNNRITSIQISESGWMWKVFNLNTKYPSNNYAYSAKTPTLQGFIYPPYVGQMNKTSASPSVDLQLATSLVATLNKYVQGYKTTYNPSEPGFIISDPPVPAEPIYNAGVKVKVKAKGNTNKLGTGKDVTVIGQTFIIKSVHKGFEFPYRIGTDSRGIGYFRESDLERV